MSYFRWVSATIQKTNKKCCSSIPRWTYEKPVPLYPTVNGRCSIALGPDDHDYGEKTFLGQSGNFDGNDVIDIIAKQEATARFIGGHLYNFFVADEARFLHGV
ncbi:MAG: hypothetical protein Ct9H300mP19_08730 [Dehalococcoidia bacterium]|nr:MAG: hypothetical protein Ct9H300mP19_08730 [Dehalococcoidia bacterium]